jgi:DNA-binding transcriptional ArsR family regulator
MGYELVLDALGDATRRRIVERLSSGPLPVGEIAGGLPVSRPAVSKHLRVLQDAGLVTHESSGTRNLYRLDSRGLDELRAWTEAYWDTVLAGFADHAKRRARRRDEDR